MSPSRLRGRNLCLLCLGLLTTWLVSSCVDQTEPVSPSTLSMWFAPLDASCTNKSNGSGKVPDAVETLAVKLEPVGEATIIRRASQSDVNKAGFWELGDLPIAKTLDVSVFGCDASGKIIYAGRSNGSAIVDQVETTVRTFLAPVATLTCTGNLDLKASEGLGTLYSPRSFVQIAKLKGGDLVVTGGLGGWTDSKGFAALGTEIYDHRGGGFRKGPAMKNKRVFHHAFGLDARHVLVVGGVSKVEQLSIDVLDGRLLAPAEIGTSLPKNAAEILDIGDASGAGAASKISPADVGAGALFLSGAADLGEALLFAGGINSAGKATRDATILSKLADVATGGEGASTHFKLLTERAGPIVLPFADGSAIIWGGHKSGKVADLAELFKAGASKTTAVTVSGAQSILQDPHLAATGAVAAILTSSADELTFIVSGGQPYDTPLSAADAPNYVVQVKNDGKATVYALELSTGTLRTGIGAAATSLVTGQALFAGGLLAPSGVAPCAPTAQECLISDITLLQLSAPLSGGKAKLSSEMTKSTLGAPRLGIAAAPLPMGALLVGGQSTVVNSAVKDAQALDPTGRIVMGPIDEAQSKLLCGK